MFDAEGGTQRVGWGVEDVVKQFFHGADSDMGAGVGRTVITAIANGNLGHISTDRLIDVAHSLGLRVQLKVA